MAPRPEVRVENPVKAAGTRSRPDTPDEKQRLIDRNNAANGPFTPTIIPVVQPKEDFLQDLLKIKAEIVAKTPSAAVMQDLQQIITWSRVLCALGYMFLMHRYSIVSLLCLSTYEMAQWTIIAHHTSHGAYNKHDPSSYYNRGKFAIGMYRRFVDWFDVISPEAWNVEHNKLHHYRLNEDTDPDLVFRNVAWMRVSKLPKFIKWIIIFFTACTWKLTYYTSNTFQYYYYEDAVVVTSEPGAEETAESKRLAAKAAFEAAAEKKKGFVRDLVGKVIMPYMGYRYLVLPFLYSALFSTTSTSTEVFVTVLVNLFLIDILTNLYTFVVIVPNHCGDDIYYFDTPVKLNSVDFYLRAIIGSTNYNTGNKVLDFLHGYLNYQIEHHMFPDLAPMHLRAIQPKVKALCAKHNIPYVQQNVFRRVWKTVQIMTGDTCMINGPSDM